MATNNLRFVSKNGLDNNGNTLTNLGVIGASLTQSGAFALTLTTTGATNVTFPTSGTLATTNGTILTATNLANGTTNSIPYQSAAGTTSFLAQGTGVLQEIAGAPAWTTTPTLTGTNFTGIPNGALTNNSITVGSTNIALGATSTSIAGLSSLSTTTLTAGGSTFTGEFTINRTGTASGIEIGSLTGATTPFIDFHSGATAVDYDSRIVATGGTGSIGGGTLTLGAATVAVGGQLTIPLGSAGSPSLAFTGDTNTGVWSPGADALAISTSGAERLRVNSLGYVGIGTANPLRPLHIAATEPAILLEETDQGTDAKIWRIFSSASTFTIDTVNDAFNSSQAGYSLLRSTTNITGHTLSTGGTARLRINSVGGVSISTGEAGAGQALAITKTMTGAVNTHGVLVSATVQSDSTTSASAFSTNLATAASAFTLGTLYHLNIAQGTIGAGSSVTTQYGLAVGGTLIGASNNYACSLNVPTGAGNNWNLYSQGSAPNYIASSLGVGTTSITGFTLRTGKNLTGSTYVRNIYAGGQVQTDVTNGGASFESNLQLADGVAMSGNWQHFSANGGTFGTGTLATQYGFLAASTLTGATNNYGFYGNISASANRWNLYMAGTAQNHMAGNLGIGSGRTVPSAALDVNGAIIAGTQTSTSGSTILQGYYSNGALTTFGTEYAVGGPVIGYGVTPSLSAANAFLSSTGVSAVRGAMTIQGNTLIFRNATATTTTIGNAITLTERFRIDADGNTNIGNSGGSGYRLDLTASALGTSIGDQSKLTSIRDNNGNSSILEITDTRTAAGSDWTTAGVRFQQKIDSTWMAWQQFNGYSNQGGITWGTGQNATSAVSVVERMRLDTNGYLAIGTTSPQRRVEVSTQLTEQNWIRVSSPGAANNLFRGIDFGVLGTATAYGSLGMDVNSGEVRLTAGYSTWGGYQTFHTNGSERMRIDSSGNVGIGNTPSGSYKLEVTGAVLATGNISGAALIPTSTTAPTTGIYKSTADRITTRINSTDVFTASMTTNSPVASIGGTPVGIARLQLSTTVDSVAVGLVIDGASSGSGGVGGMGGWIRTDGITSYKAFRFDVSGSEAGSISHPTSSTTAYNTSSDVRLKENIQPAISFGNVIDAINVVSFDWKTDNVHQRAGMIAQELAQVVPEAVKVGDTGEEITDTWGVDYSKLVPMLIKEIQELRARVAALEATN